tara:strand:- start:808 stop:1032 length:225 start_codon:yes stop_codon:yes gene_type:complete
VAEIKFSVSDQAEAYLDWMAREVLFVKTPSAAAKHLMMSQLEHVRRTHRHTEPSSADLGVPGPINGGDDGAEET